MFFSQKGSGNQESQNTPKYFIKFLRYYVQLKYLKDGVLTFSNKTTKNSEEKTQGVKFVTYFFKFILRQTFKTKHLNYI